jgi:uncharacterized protein YcnI
MVAATTAIFVAPAAAHVSIQPATADANRFQEYTVRVPTEKDVPTTSVRVVFPEGFDALRFRPPAPGWRYELERDAKGRIASVTWSGSTIGREEYELFQFMARSRKPGRYKLEAYQTYNGSEVVGWVNDAEPRPAPQITITAAAAPSSSGTDPFAQGQGSKVTASAAADVAPGLIVSAGVPLWLGGGALLLAALSLVVALRASRRARLAD